MIVGITIANMMPSELKRIVFSANAIGPCGSSTPPEQPPSIKARIGTIIRQPMTRRSREGLAILTQAADPTMAIPQQRSLQ